MYLLHQFFKQSDDLDSVGSGNTWATKSCSFLFKLPDLELKRKMKRHSVFLENLVLVMANFNR